MGAVQVVYYTDPICPWSWALEPTVRTLLTRFGDQLRFTYVMCGMMREQRNPLAQIGDALEASAASAMPVDPRLWLSAAPSSSHPACIAVKAAAEQGDPSRYLRRIREGLLCRRRKLDAAEALVEEAQTAGLDTARFRIDLGSHAILEAYGADLERAAAVSAEEQEPGTGRVKLPSLQFIGEDGAIRGVYGFSSYEELSAMAVAAGAVAGAAIPAPLDALRRFGSMATAEVAAVCDLAGPRAPAELWRLASEWRVKPERVGGGELLWTLP